ncbi:hypothetical protein [Shewanella fodinae]|uniref:Uncharacterized protein n=1 Tax=Shewanella fodinae TaxID=552357 RepID=A0A4V2RSR9_9GAMM|nr:hypothetical protein [Shewanella fodinae]TCN87043.1 hypothetical protein EDC91_10545 [Shewanella fodinae]
MTLKVIRFVVHKEKNIQVENIELSEHEYLELSKARSILSKILSHEELYDQIIESYIDAKSAMYEMSIRSISAMTDIDFVKNHNCRSKLNRLYFNTLNLSKLYLDRHYREHKDKSGSITKITCFAESITKSKSDIDEIKKQRDDLFEKNKDYVLGCELRNFVQHSSLPVKTFTSGVRSSFEEDKASAIFNIPLDKQTLLDGRVKNKILSEYGEKIDLHKVMDGYIHAISEMHLKSRTLVEEYVNKSELLIDKKRLEIEKKYINCEYGIDVVDNDTEKRLFSLHLEWFSVAKHLMKKNSCVLNYYRFIHEPYQK